MYRDDRPKVIDRYPRRKAELERLARARQPSGYDPTAIVLGRNAADEPVILPERPRLEHMHVIGATGSGKTTFLEHCIRQDIRNGRGVCVIDPHGNHRDSLYRKILTWLHEEGHDKSRVVHLIDPNAPARTIGFNPLALPDQRTASSVIAEAMYEAFVQVWGEEGNKPTIERVLTAAFTALVEQGLTLAESNLLFDPADSHGIRAGVIAQIGNAYARDELSWLDSMSKGNQGQRDFRAEVVGPLNRLAPIMRTDALRAIVGQKEGIDLRQAMDDGHIILANLAGGSQMFTEGADLLGRLLLRFLFFNAERRYNTDRPFFIYADECHRYLSGDIPRMLGEVRKYGVGIVLAHQWLQQLGPPDDPIREAVCKAPNLRAVFRLKDPTEAEAIAESVFNLDLETPVEALIKPTVVGQRRSRFASGSTTKGEGQTRGVGRSKTENSSYGVTDSASETESSSVTRSKQRGASESWGGSQQFSETNSRSSSLGDSHTAASSSSKATSEGRSFDEDDLDEEDPIDNRVNRSSQEGAAASESDTHSETSTESTSETYGSGENWNCTFNESEGVAFGSGRAQQRGRAETRTRGHAVTESETQSNSESMAYSEGFSEGMEPIFEDRPTAVHSKENMLYMAAHKLRTLPTGVAIVHYVGDGAEKTAMVRVPTVAIEEMSEMAFEQLRDDMMKRNSFTLSTAQALLNIDARKDRLIAEGRTVAAEPPDPTNFREPLPKPKGKQSKKRPETA